MATAEIPAPGKNPSEQRSELPAEAVREIARGPVLLFDGECGVCATSVQWVLIHEKKPGLRFASLQSPAGRQFFAASGLAEEVDSLIWLEATSEGFRVDYYADAVRSALRYVGGPWRLLDVLLGLVPRPLRDLGYRGFARHRLSMAAGQCLIPTPTQKARFFEQPANALPS